MTRPNSNLPPAAQDWRRHVEGELDANEGTIARLTQENEALRNEVGTMQNHLADLQNYVRAICVLGGYGYPPAASAEEKPGSPPVVAPPSTVTYKDVEVGASWSCTWGSGGFKYTTPSNGDTDANSLFQRGSGAKFAMWRFDIGAARGKKIVKAEMFLSNISTYYNGAFTAVLGTHGNSTEPASRPGGRSNGFDVGWQARQGKWISIPTNLWGGLSNGTIQGFTLGDGQATTSNYARFNGVGRAGAPRIRIRYEA